LMQSGVGVEKVPRHKYLLTGCALLSCTFPRFF
jgi:hypothetical protein